ncbi:MAG: hypothetical protein FWF52_06595 [Candidatus Azobacteroides sp.]|nr:hypothetical protein [Candidatus Azobacteroides sp.]
MDIFNRTIKFFNYQINKKNLGSLFFSIQFEKQYDYLYHFSEPENDIERSFYQYRCQCFVQGKINVFFKEIISGVFFLPFILFLLIKRILIKNKREKIQNIYIATGANNIDNEYLSTKFGSIKDIYYASNYYLSYRDLVIIAKLIYSHPFSPFWYFKNSYKLSIYRYIIDSYSPENILCSSEYSFTSSLLTSYCEMFSIRHVNVMHGEKLFFIRDSFFHFHECFIWDNHYRRLFNSLRALCDQYYIFLPKEFRLNNKNNKKVSLGLTYYLDSESKKGLLAIRKTLLSINIPPSKIAIRYHPRYNKVNLKFINETFKDFIIENPFSTSIIESFSITKCVASLYSTVLFQAYLFGNSIVIDDYSCPERYNQLLKMNYIIMNKPHYKISDLLRKNIIL